MNVLDIIILLLFIPGIIRGLSKGFVEQAVTLAGIVAAIWAAYKYYGPVAQKLATYIQAPDAAVNVISFVVVLLAVIIVVMIIAKIITKAISMANLSWINRLIGVVFSIAVSVVVISLIIILLDTVNEKFEFLNSPVVQESLLYGSLKDIGYAVFPYLKELGSIVTE